MNDCARDVRYWHKADIPSCTSMSAIGGKADIEILEYCKADMKIGPDSLPT